MLVVLDQYRQVNSRPLLASGTVRRLTLVHVLSTALCLPSSVWPDWIYQDKHQEI